MKRAVSDRGVLRIQAPAKVNFRLEVVGRRGDGYHDLRMLMVPVSLYDTLYVRRLPASEGIYVETPGSPPAVACGEENLCHAAARFYFLETGVEGGAGIELVKRIPAGAGLGGGSSDAATTILALERLYGVPLSDTSRRRAAFRVGADVPFFFARGPAWVTGVGETVFPLTGLPPLWLVLVCPGVFLSTAEVFSRYTTGLTTPVRPPTITQLNFRSLVRGLHNDLLAAAVAVEPVIGEALNVIAEVGAPGWLMSGSGSAVFGVFEREAAARVAAAQVADHPRATEWQSTVVRVLSPGAFPFPTE